MAGTRNSGRKKKPENLKVIQGTFRKDRANPNAPEAATGDMLYPLTLDEEEKPFFDYLKSIIAEIGLESPTYSEALGQAASILHDISELKKDIREEGRSYWTESRVGGRIKKVNPSVSQLEVARRQYHSFLSDFGITPSSIQKVGGGQTGKPASPFAEFMNG